MGWWDVKDFNKMCFYFASCPAHHHRVYAINRLAQMKFILWKVMFARASFLGNIWSCVPEF